MGEKKCNFWLFIVTSGGDTDSEREIKEKEKISSSGTIFAARIYLKANSRDSIKNDGISRMKNPNKDG